MSGTGGATDDMQDGTGEDWAGGDLAAGIGAVAVTRMAAMEEAAGTEGCELRAQCRQPLLRDPDGSLCQ